MNIDKENSLLGILNDPTTSASLTGPCGDTMVFSLIIREDEIEDIRVYTEGCPATKMCALETAKQALNKTTYEALGISPKQIMDLLKDLPEDHKHCAILAVSTLYRAIANYFLEY